MSKFFVGLLGCVAGLSLGLSSVANASLMNAGFEAGIAGWTPSLNGGSASVVSSHAGEFGTYTPVGSSMLGIVAGAADTWQTVSQAVSLNAGDTLAGAYAFDWRDYDPFKDGLQVTIYDSASLVVYQTGVDGTGNPDYWDGPWTAWSWTAATGGNYTLEYGVINTLDDFNSSVGLFDDNFGSYSAIPEPGSFLVWGVLGLAGVGMTNRRRRS